MYLSSVNIHLCLCYAPVNLARFWGNRSPNNMFITAKILNFRNKILPAKFEKKNLG